MPVGESTPFAYAMLRLVPRAERGERINVGVVLFCRQAGGFLGLRWRLDAARLAAVAPELDPTGLEPQLAALARIAEGHPDAGALGTLEPSERFGWLVAPSSTIIQASEVHTGICTDPAGQLDDLFERLVA